MLSHTKTDKFSYPATRHPPPATRHRFLPTHCGGVGLVHPNPKPPATFPSPCSFGLQSRSFNSNSLGEVDTRAGAIATRARSRSFQGFLFGEEGDGRGETEALFQRFLKERQMQVSSSSAPLPPPKSTTTEQEMLMRACAMERRRGEAARLAQKIQLEAERRGRGEDMQVQPTSPAAHPGR
jgi:hypothetical protein